MNEERHSAKERAAWEDLTGTPYVVEVAERKEREAAMRRTIYEMERDANEGVDPHWRAKDARRRVDAFFAKLIERSA